MEKNRNTTVVTLVLASPSYFLAALFVALAAFCQYHDTTVLAVPSILLALLAGTQAQSLSVNTARKRYRLGSQILGFTSGPWQVLPPTQRVVIRYFSDIAVVSSDSGGGGTELAKDSRFIVLLSIPNSQQADVVMSTSNYTHALKAGYFLGTVLGVEVVSVNQYKQQEVLQEADPDND
ncbi:hypothetical protein [Hymenobacter rigui]|uniref:Uncharacterized protein n=1 Tax=Hymenobacter rigui TaxID=334424 RepID=A0A428KQZ1_9BACT|nr:hypothetical protein [Hymenobacter rigui]RSK48879.1 hypothetical protein EI291_09955 [Hymenobacter rigui]